MFLKRIEMMGFKSFPDRIRLEFKPGLTAVVGPNGSGKSNIADAVRWVMGEQSAKSLRGAKMEDIIFSGTQHRRPLGYAEVIMTVDNTDHMLPMEFSEVTVTRRVYRSGESEFALNGTSCRLKDIQMLFMDTGVGREGYSIIGQGRIDEILSVRSEDRRLLFEEAAGIVKFKTRRNEALAKLERERQNLTRVNDIIEELAAQMEPLALQSEQAKLYLSLREQYKVVHINLFLEEAQRIEAELIKTGETLTLIVAQTEAGQSTLSEARLAVGKLKGASGASEAQYRVANERLIGLVTEIEKKESDIKLLETRLSHTQGNRERLEGEIGKRDAAITQRLAEQESESANHVQADAQLNVLNTRLSERQEEYKALDEAMRAREQAWDEYNRAIMARMSEAADLKAKQREAESLYARLEEDKERINSEILHNDTLLEAEQKRRDMAEAAHTANTRESGEAQTRINAYVQAREALIAARNVLADKHRKSQSEMQEVASRHKVMSELEQHREGYYRSVKAVLRKKEDDPHFAGICGAVGELISVSREYETAVEIALGGAAQNIITQTEDDAKRAIALLKATREGRATFLPLTAVKGRLLDTKRPGLDQEPGYVGLASSLVSYDAPYAGVIAQLLGNAVVMSHLDTAMAVHKKYRYAYKLVTLDGELLSPGGAMTGGGAAKSGLIGRTRQLAELTEKLTALKESTQVLSDALREQEGKITATEEALQHAREHSHQLMLERNNIENQLTQSDERLADITARAKALSEENNRIMARLVETNSAIRGAKKEAAAQEEAVEAARQERDAYQRQISGERNQKDERVQSLADLRVEISRVTERINTAQANKTRLSREIKVLQAEKETLQKECVDSEKSEEKNKQDIQQCHEALALLKTHLEEQRKTLTTIEGEKAELEKAIQRAEADERAQMDDAARLSREITRLEMRKEQLDTDSRRLYDEIWDEYGLTGQTAVAYKREDMSAAYLHREEKRLKAELAPLTAVNVGAIESYRQLKTRYDFMTTQRDDILEAEESLRDVAKTLTQQMEIQFAERFEQISRHFNEVFREMFGGGKAGLSLLDGKNILESGIEITAQPPGKSLQTLLLLSGGERALTAIALLFGILRMKPSPFCLLDEIEAALDDANVNRFGQYLKQYASGTQFIVITHRRGTMAAADTLYGVTMEEVGISKMVSVRFVDTEEK